MATKKVATKEVATKAVATKSQEEKTMKENTTAVVAKEEVKNAEKKNNFISIEEVTNIYAELGIKCKNPTAKGSYRIMGSGSSLNVKPTKGYYIYTSDADMELVQSAGLKNEDLVIEGRTNAQDKQRPNTIVCTALETLKALLAVYAKNPANVLAKEETKPAVAAK